MESIFTKDELLTNIMLYWVTETATCDSVWTTGTVLAPTWRAWGLAPDRYPLAVSVAW